MRPVFEVSPGITSDDVVYYTVITTQGQIVESFLTREQAEEFAYELNQQGEL